MKLNEYRFLITKYLSFVPRVRVKTKVVYIWADDTADAYKQMKLAYNDWDIHMFWPTGKTKTV